MGWDRRPLGLNVTLGGMVEPVLVAIPAVVSAIASLITRARARQDEAAELETESQISSAFVEQIAVVLGSLPSADRERLLDGLTLQTDDGSRLAGPSVHLRYRQRR